MLRFGVFAMFLFTVLALIAGTSSAQSTTGFHISGRNLIDANGNNFIMRGINHPHSWYPTQTSAFANIKNTVANAAQTGGDSNDYEVNASNTYANDGLFAVDNISVTNSNSSCTNSGKDKHRFYNYNITLPGGIAVKGIKSESMRKRIAQAVRPRCACNCPGTAARRGRARNLRRP